MTWMKKRTASMVFHVQLCTSSVRTVRARPDQVKLLGQYLDRLVPHVSQGFENQLPANWMMSNN